ncbi:zeta toxin family protein [Microbacterium sp. 2FI]|uniref:zeta toxin family protein n=1 Tax=Microbacterium sp. 2FI TaxID=2502193 RepID=UPI0014852F3F|nr:zeta toxin family protein [Microbacterium sp. 2FI]
MAEVAAGADRAPSFEVVRDILFRADGVEQPTFTVVAGEAGSGRGAVAAFVARELDGAAVVSADDAVMSDPQSAQLLRWRPLEAPSAVSGPAAEVLEKSIAYAQASRRSLVLEGTFGSPETVFAVAEMFADEGFATRTVVVASRRAASLLAAASTYLWERQARLPARFTSREVHRRGWESTRALAAALAESSAVDRATVVGRDGAVLFDADRSAGAASFDGAARAVAAVDDAPWTPRAAAEWFSELRRATDFARASREMAPPAADLLLELHRVGLNEVLPAMPFPKGSSVVAEQERRLVEEIVDLTQNATPPRRVTQPAPQPSSAPAVEPSRSTGPSL